jgi:hypothetical protein
MFHKEGFAIIRNTLIGLITLNTAVWYLAGGFNIWVNLLIFASAVLLVLILQFF